MISKTDEHQYYFEVQLNHKEGRIGTLSAKDVTGTIEVATPPEFAGGVPDKWSPEHLFLSSLCSCLMTTFLAIAEKKRLQVCNFECSSIGQVKLYEGHLEFTTIDLFPKIFVETEADFTLANETLLKTYKHCIIANSIKSLLVHHGEVLVCKKQVA
ncbi:MAG TPA: OsmC family protein [Ferruginibacter sp.]|nr:osmotically inducible protein OsmC [Chitinophagaceae bacterium]HRI26130.1 OsmC family protein [Ferruginibacter sp.]